MPRPFTSLRSRAIPMLTVNIDTDQIIPSREMRSTGKTGLAKGLFAGWRYLSGTDYEPDPAFMLNHAEFAGAGILLAGENFGCGSSREHAVWALAEYGIRTIIAPSFAPIFQNNCSRNGLLCIALSERAIEEISQLDGELTVDLSTQKIALSGGTFWGFEIDDEAKAILTSGLEPIDLTLKHSASIANWQAADAKERPWIYLNPQDQQGHLS
ncbi:MAG: 3-isopropylmalate dehydratase small subunit [Erythrobacter sp.]|uniref:3-isopropylmalate dehydratase small subunit n=1 Tax=Erythrobacter sp. TaxID=1042 RepID=UPI0032649FF7